MIEAPRWVVAVDTGGTFTDVVAVSGSEIRTLKVASTPDDPSRAVLEGVTHLVGDGVTDWLLHGTTVATNALLERKGGRVGLITNRGFEDVLEIGRQNRPQLYALVGHRAPPLAVRGDRLGIAGRLDPGGNEIEPLDAAEMEALAAWAADRESIAICLLHAYANPAHEDEVARALAGWSGPLSVSSRILPEFREYERTSTVVVNAFVAPVMSGYLERLARASDAGRIGIMGSGGGTIPVNRAAREPVHTVLSGPAGGVVGALEWSRRSGVDNIITFDMGGTSTDVSLCPGRPLRTREFDLDGIPVSVPVIDIHTVGAGGGSLARLDTGGALKVGPESAGAVPGPICYGRGGERVTVTDAQVWLGRLPAAGFLGGGASLDRDSIRGPMEALAQGMGTSPEAAAEGVIAVADAAMERALRVISVERGYDPREFTLVAFGGAGGLHVAELAERIGCRGAIVPPNPGLLSAFGILVAPPSKELSRTTFLRSDGEWSDAMAETIDQLSEEATRSLVDDGHASESIGLSAWVDARYVGQSFELRVPADGWVESFHDLHEERYGYRRADTPVEGVTVRVVAEAPALEVRTAELAESSGSKPTDIPLHSGDGVLHVPMFQRETLGSGIEIEGPAVIAEYSATTWVPAGWTASVDRVGSLHLSR